jgi:hypothetical protein
LLGWVTRKVWKHTKGVTRDRNSRKSRQFNGQKKNNKKTFVFIYAYWSPTLFPYQMIFVSFEAVEQELLTITEHLRSPPFLWIRVAQFHSLLCKVMSNIVVFLLFFFWPLNCLLFLELRSLVTPLVCFHTFLVTQPNNN